MSEKIIGKLSPPHFKVLGVAISAVSLESAAQIIARWVKDRERRFVTVTGVHGVIEAQGDPMFKWILNRSGICVPDGVPIVWLAWLAGHSGVTRVFGPDLMLKVSSVLGERNGSAFYYGGLPGVADELATAISARYPGIQTAGTYSPPFRELTDGEARSVVDLVNRSGADVLWVGLSTPKQERWMWNFRARLKVPVIAGVGAAFDYNTERIGRAPRWIQQGGFEWFYRLVQDPRRLWKRYARNNPLFVYYLLCEKLRLRKFDID